MSFASTVLRTATSVWSGVASAVTVIDFRDGAGLEHRSHRGAGGGIERHAGLRPLLEALELDRHVVEAGRQRRQDVVAVARR